MKKVLTWQTPQNCLKNLQGSKEQKCWGSCPRVFNAFCVEGKAPTWIAITYKFSLLVLYNKASENLKTQECYILKTEPVPLAPQVFPITLDYLNLSVPQLLQF